jgi:hypothetical protein
MFDFEKLAYMQADGRKVYGGWTLKDIKDMGLNNFRTYLLGYQKRKMTETEIVHKYDFYMKLVKLYL